MNKFHYILFFALFLHLKEGYSQSIDTLFIQINQAKINSEKLTNLNLLTEKLRKQDKDSTHQYYKLLINTGKQKKDSLILSKAYLEYSKKYIDQKKLKKSEIYLDSAFQIINKPKSKEMAYIYCNAITVKGNLYHYRGNYNKALKKFQQALTLAQKYHFEKYILFNLNNIASLLIYQSKFRKALTYYKKNLSQAKKLDYQNVIDYALLNISSCYYFLNKPDSAYLYIDKAMTSAKNHQNLLVLALSYNEYGELLILKKQDKNALASFNKAIRINPNEYKFYINRGFIYKRNNQFTKAKKDYLEAKSLLIQQKNTIILPNIYDSISNLYYKQGMYKKSNDYIFKSIHVSDSLFKKQKETRILRLQKKYKLNEIEKTIKIQGEAIDKQNTILKRSSILLWVSIILSSIVIVFFIIFYNKRKVQNQKKSIQKLQQERNRIAEDLHDNLGAHLSFIISSMDGILYETNQPKENILSKLNNIRDFAMETTGIFRDTIWALNKKGSFLVADFENRLILFIERIQKLKPKIKVSLQNDINENMMINPTQSLHAFRVIQEAVSNAAKYSKSDEIFILLEEDLENYYFKIIDKGIGFKEEEIAFGYGIKNMKRRIKQINGNLIINSNKGTEITIILTKNKVLE